MKLNFNDWGPMTVLMVAIVVIVVCVGGVVVVVHPATLSFDQYLDDLKAFALAIAGLGVARAIPLAAERHASLGVADEDELNAVPARETAITPDTP